MTAEFAQQILRDGRAGRPIPWPVVGPSLAEAVCGLWAIVAAMPPPVCACGALATWLEPETGRFRCGACHAVATSTGGVPLPPRAP